MKCVLDTMNKIISIDEPKDKKLRWGLYVIHYEDKNGEKYDAHMFKEEYDVIIFKRHLLEIGFSEVDLDKYEELLNKKWNREKSLERC